MQLVAKLNGTFFRGQTVTENEIEIVKETMLRDCEELTFETMTDKEFDAWINTW